MAMSTAGPRRTTLGRAVSAVEPAVLDAELLARCRAGDAHAWDSLVRRYERLVYSVALRNGLKSEDAADVCQQTFIALLESIDRLNDDYRLASWLMTVARRHAWRARRREAQETPLGDLPEFRVDPFENWEQVAAVHDALDQLSNPCRDLLEALYFDPSSPSYSTIASRFNRSIGGIGPLRGRCLQRLRELMVDESA
jgi:RNA polymerase sigma factor (sigma-70 family)